jgi:hypothetical protein
VEGAGTVAVGVTVGGGERLIAPIPVLNDPRAEFIGESTSEYSYPVPIAEEDDEVASESEGEENRRRSDCEDVADGVGEYILDE